MKVSPAATPTTTALPTTDSIAGEREQEVRSFDYTIPTVFTTTKAPNAIILPLSSTSISSSFLISRPRVTRCRKPCTKDQIISI